MPTATHGSPTVALPVGATWQTSGLTPLGDVQLAGDIPVLAALIDGKPNAVGLDPRTGAVLWKRPVTHSAVTPGVSMSITTIRDRWAVILEPDYPDYDSAEAHLAVIDAATGTVVNTSVSTPYLSFPERCSGAEQLACASTTRRVLLGIGPDPKDDLPVRGAFAGEGIGPAGLHRQIVDPDLTISRVVAGTELWRRTETELFGQGWTTNGGWAFMHDEQRKLIVGTVGHDGDEKQQGKSVPMTSLTELVALTESGQPAWRRPGFDTMSLDSTDSVYDRGRGPLLALQWAAGTVTLQGRGGEATLMLRAGRLVLHRLDPSNGRTMWQVPLGDVPDGDLRDVSLGRLTHEVSARTTQGEVIVDVETGKSRQARATDVSWSRHTVDYRQPIKRTINNETIFERHGYVWQATSGGKTAGLRPLTEVPPGVAVTGHGVAYVAYESGVVAYPSR